VTATRTVPMSKEDTSLFAAARLRAARMQPYLANAVFSLIPVSSPGYGTFGVDRWWRVYVDMDQAREWGVEPSAAVLLHEAHHLLRGHHKRAEVAGADGEFLHRLWNFAADAAINDDLVDGDVPLPRPVLPSTLGLPAGLLEETYFGRLKELTERPPAPRCGSGSGGVPLPDELDGTDNDVPAVDEIDAAALRRDVAHAVTAAQATGDSVSPGLSRWAQTLLQPQVRWQTVLRAAMGKSLRGVTGRRHPSWQRPDRRADARPEFPLPGTVRLEPAVAVVIDTSASMSQRLLDAAITELNALLRRTGARGADAVVCDNQAAVPQRVRHVGQVCLRGGGGTDLRIGIGVAAELRPARAVIVVLTDGGTPWPAAAPPGTSLIAVIIGRDVEGPTGPGITSVLVDEPG